MMISDYSLYELQAMESVEKSRSCILLNGTVLADEAPFLDEADKAGSVEPAVPEAAAAALNKSGQVNGETGGDKSSWTMTPRSAEEAQAAKRRSISSRGPSSEPPKWSPKDSKRAYPKAPPSQFTQKNYCCKAFYCLIYRIGQMYC